ncbi:MAG: OsmC family protein [Luteibaculaceae bacterium]
MQIAEIEYKGKLLVEAKHLKSGTTVTSDAPEDNNGKGSKFSPTDLVSTALAQCLITIMGIKAQTWGKDLSMCTAKVSKIMASGPRRISGIEINLTLSKENFNEKEMDMLEVAAKACPVAKSLHPDLEQKITFSWV